jgi:hypothetical protein
MGSAEGVGASPVAGEAPPAKVANPAKVGLHPQLSFALTRELWPTDGERTFLIDTSVRAKVTLLEQVPEKIDLVAWRAAVLGLSRSLAGRIIPRGYDDQPLITLKVPAKET